MTSSSAQLDELLANPTRLSIMAVLAAADWAEFAFVRDTVEASDSALSKQISTLSANAYIEVRKGYVGRRPRTWLNITDAGRHALERHVAALHAIVARASTTKQRPPTRPPDEPEA